VRWRRAGIATSANGDFTLMELFVRASVSQRCRVPASATPTIITFIGDWILTFALRGTTLFGSSTIRVYLVFARPIGTTSSLRLRALAILHDKGNGECKMLRPAKPMTSFPATRMAKLHPFPMHLLAAETFGFCATAQPRSMTE